MRLSSRLANQLSMLFVLPASHRYSAGAHSALHAFLFREALVFSHFTSFLGAASVHINYIKVMVNSNNFTIFIFLFWLGSVDEEQTHLVPVVPPPESIGGRR